ncbi:hypothetical protein AAVH_12221 [Aphelenchoides avenae]|nr:hypothetical protein AAVH_12221 [Aphelenchus avenae]
MRTTILNGKTIPRPCGPRWSDPRTEFICKAVQEAAFASHVDCYTKCGFCKLSASDWARYGTVIDLEDLDAKTVAKTVWACRRDILGKVPEAWLSMNLFAQDIFTDILLVGMIMALR